MKTILIAAVCFVVALSTVYAATEDGLEYIKKFPGFEDCAKEHGITEPTLEKTYEKILAMTDKHAQGCLDACYLKKSGIIKDGKINLDKAKEVIENVHAEHADTKEKHVNMAKSCAEKVKDETEECNMAGKYTACFLGMAH